MSDGCIDSVLRKTMIISCRNSSTTNESLATFKLINNIFAQALRSCKFFASIRNSRAWNGTFVSCFDQDLPRRDMEEYNVLYLALALDLSSTNSATIQFGHWCSKNTLRDRNC